jgi:hypothetical protein
MMEGAATAAEGRLRPLCRKAGPLPLPQLVRPLPHSDEPSLYLLQHFHHPPILLLPPLPPSLPLNHRLRLLLPVDLQQPPLSSNASSPAPDPPISPPNPAPKTSTIYKHGNAK